jgi:hypothetical protein
MNHPVTTVLLLTLGGVALRADDRLQVQTIRYRDLPAGIAHRFDPATFNARIEAIERDTARREREGELDHLIYYALQSQRFTRLSRIEPALSARELIESGRVPEPVRARLQAFLGALAKPGTNQRLHDFASLLDAGQRTQEFLQSQYRRAMRFLYEKEFQHREAVYQTRGHSTDTQVEANYAVRTGLSVLRQLQPETQVRRVLIVGPGLDFAPRTELFDAVAPQSFQPYAVADALFSLGLAWRGDLEIDCADINTRVIEFINRFPRGPRRLELYSEPGGADYNRYFAALGNSIGRAEAHGPPAPLPSTYLAKTLRVDAGVAQAVRAAKLNILTGRRAAAYDLIVATNVLLYFHADELSLALANIAAMLPPGGYFLHNEIRAEADELAAAAGLEPVQARTLRLTGGRKAPLFDAFAIYRKRSGQ